MAENNLTATRFAQKPLHQPTYSFSHVPKACRDLKNSNLQEINDRQNFQLAMAEMLLLCKEATRRRPGKPAGGSKPLSLEYMADRLDIDDPLFGYIVRTNENETGSQNWQKGMLQGFITVTTFTNWQRTFRWDSSIDAAFESETEEMESERLSGERKWDSSNELAEGLQQSVRYGDIWNEGVVWPRVAEISLLGGLGCGRALVSLVIEKLERMKANNDANYDYVVLQATDNSIPFYESMGFVRVGAVTEVDEAEKNKELLSDDSATDSGVDIVAEPLEEGSPEKPDTVALPDHVVTCEAFSYTVKKAGTTVSQLAKRFDVDPWDICYLNRRLYEGMTANSRLLNGTVLHIPAKKTSPSSPNGKPKPPADFSPKYYTAKENDTPRKIARIYQVDCLELVEANKARLPGLVSSSRLKDGTKVRVSHLDQPDTVFKPYAHWSFPDDNFEEGEPSYMMALKLNRRRGKAALEFPFRDSLSSPLTGYKPTSLLLPPSPLAKQKALPVSLPVNLEKAVKHPDEPKPPKKALGPFFLFCSEFRETHGDQLHSLPAPAASRYLADKWKAITEDGKAKYVEMGAKAKDEYFKAKAQYEEELKEFRAKHPAVEKSVPQSDSLSAGNVENTRRDLFNKVVKLKPQAITVGCKYEYWYVLTYIPDLKWCHLAPMVKVGAFGPDKPRADGRPKWMLVDESLGEEVDISASFCIPIKARFMRKTLDADKEEWDVIDDGTPPTERKARKPFRLERDDESWSSTTFPTHPPPLASLASVESLIPDALKKAENPPLVASFPGMSTTVSVRLQVAEATKRRGRPKGSKNRIKKQPEDAYAGKACSKYRLDGCKNDDLAPADRLATAGNVGPSIGPGPKKIRRGLKKVPKSRAEMIAENKKTSPRRSPRRSPAGCDVSKGNSVATPNRKRNILSSSSDVSSDNKASKRGRLPGTEPTHASKRPRRSAAPTFLGEVKSPPASKSDKIPYNPRRSITPSDMEHSDSVGPESATPIKRRLRKLDSPKSAAKRWHPIRDTRNGKTVARSTTPRGRTKSKSILENLDERTNTRKSPRSEIHVRPRRKSAPSFSLMEKSLGTRGGSKQL